MKETPPCCSQLPQGDGNGACMVYWGVCRTYCCVPPLGMLPIQIFPSVAQLWMVMWKYISTKPINWLKKWPVCQGTIFFKISWQSSNKAIFQTSGCFSKLGVTSSERILPPYSIIFPDPRRKWSGAPFPLQPPATTGCCLHGNGMIKPIWIQFQE